MGKLHAGDWAVFSFQHLDRAVVPPGYRNGDYAGVVRRVIQDTESNLRLYLVELETGLSIWADDDCVMKKVPCA